MLLPFRNVTKRPEQEWLTAGAPLMIAQILGQFRDLNVVPDEALAAARHRIGIAADAMPDVSQLRRIARETGGWTAISGSIFATGRRVRITAQAMDVATSRVLLRAEADVDADDDTRAAFDTLSMRLVAPTGVSGTGLSVAALTTESLDAFRAYALGLRLFRESRFREAEVEFGRAIALDSTFALAWNALAASSVNSGGVQVLFNPMSTAYRAVERAAGLPNRLPPRERALVRAIQAYMHGEIRRANRSLDSLLLANPEYLDAAYYVAMIQVIAPPVDTSLTPPRLHASPNRAVMLARMILERDPGRRIIYQIPIWIYGLGGGMMWGDFFGYKHEKGSLAAVLMFPPDLREVPVLRGDTLELVPRAVFDSLPAAEQERLRRRSADMAWVWAERWLVAGPEDADAHLWAARVASIRDDHDRALNELRIADSIGIQSTLENLPGWKLSLLLRAGHRELATAMADSMLADGSLTRSPFIRTFDLRRSYGAVTLLLAKQWDRAAHMAELMGPPPGESVTCASLHREITAFPDATVPEYLRRAVMDTVAAHASEVSEQPILAPCLQVLSRGLYPR